MLWFPRYLQGIACCLRLSFFLIIMLWCQSLWVLFFVVMSFAFNFYLNPNLSPSRMPFVSCQVVNVCLKVFCKAILGFNISDMCDLAHILQVHTPCISKYEENSHAHNIHQGDH